MFWLIIPLTKPLEYSPRNFCGGGSGGGGGGGSYKALFSKPNYDILRYHFSDKAQPVLRTGNFTQRIKCIG